MENPMTLHVHEQDFRNLITITATARGMRQSFIEKDYWVTWVLRNLADSALAEQVVFKGGTSLSKGYGLIDRFSEDVDLAVIRSAQQSDGALRKLIREIHKTAAGNLPEIAVPDSTSKRGHNRLVYHQYPHLFTDPVPTATEHILLEITAFGEPEPHSKRRLISYLGQYLLDQGQPEAVREYGLDAFDFNVLSLARTFAEKIMALVRASYEEDPVAEASRKVRHLYDLHQLASQPEIIALLTGSNLAQQLTAVQRDDARAGVTGPTGGWKTNPLSTCWAYAEDAANLQQLQQPYEQELPSLLHSPLPAFDQVLRTMQRIARLLRDYDAF
ncbi:MULTISPECIES: nucleotidyl transferase AbiEii/AbiGii toxin family protein [Hymenobacter]|uniref:Nucleotidyl transferase AbiEii/AbiGii toxin family protein n=1 Tax=Hymenobacter lapidiphilus TaxID=2608003 RepID=A0A7Y7PSH6_9BACT|nr:MULTISPECIES: nucleotidyl transferase AbiEii/AbiGii toxin family protein [Hymenobacter]NVO33067.1 nucleotidyl transferase AbiEii/AbiGii toxin family protein [Hymenobacter lapidiphilus]RFP64410.1 nucleotidyl transferase AbiEii/AbiGii toxin family protein [Hymenobacter sp. CCM 8763]